MRLAIALVVVLAFPVFGAAQTSWYVPDDFPSIQGAITGSANGDTIIVRAGTYVENIEFLGKAIILKSDDGAETTVIDGNQAGSVVTFIGEEDADTLLKGFTITNGNALNGGGIHCYNSAPTLVDNTISKNTATYEGGGLVCFWGASPTLINNTISENTTTGYGYGGGISCIYAFMELTNNSIKGNSASYGGGIHFFTGSATIENNEISDNTATTGGGICCMKNSTPTLTGNTISVNSVAGYGGGICCIESSPVLNGNTISGNTASLGGGLYCEEESSPALDGNTILENSAVDDGGGIYCYDSSSPALTNNTVANNTAVRGGGVFCLGHSSPVLTDNAIKQNTATVLGGGLACWDDSSPTLINNTISENESLYGDGGGLCIYNSSPVLNGNRIKRNTASGKGGGIFCGETSQTLMNNTVITGNTAGWYGGGIYCWHASSTFTNSTITENTASVRGGGICCWNSSSPALSNMILWHNTAPTGMEIAIGDTSYPSSPKISFSNVKGGQAVVHAEPGSSLTWGPGMIDNDPLFVDPAQEDLHLTRRSPCINRGTNAGAPPDDLEGETRPCMGTVDMGADEFTGIHTLAAQDFTLAQSAGGSISFALHADVGHGKHGYCIFGTRSGTTPGHLLPGGAATLPVNFDAFTDIVLNGLNTPGFASFLGVLDGMGRGRATLRVRPGTLPTAWVGSTMHFAFAVDTFDLASNPVEVEIVP